LPRSRSSAPASASARSSATICKGRNPSAAPTQFANLLLGFALAEATGLFGLVVALIILFVF
jgi:F0F1-type ATP synthase membrane subunit c/vacuolar-type H+-ATPase subunit K